MDVSVKNILWVDYAKVIGIFLVIFGHTIENMNLINIYDKVGQLWDYIYLFHMPLFFIVSGYLYKKYEQDKNFGKVLYGLIIPYLIYQFIFYPFSVTNNIVVGHVDSIQALIKSLAGIVIGDFYITNFSLPVCGPCWFFLPIIFIRILFSRIDLSLRKLVLMVIASMCLLKVLLSTTTDLIFCLDNTIMALPYFILGYGLRRSDLFNKLISCNDKKINILLGIFILIASLILYALLKINGLVEMNLEIIPEYANRSVILTYIAGIIGSLAVILFSKFFIAKNDFVDTVSKNTLFIIFFHFLIIYLLKWADFKKLAEMINNPYCSLLVAFIIAVLILLSNYHSFQV